MREIENDYFYCHYGEKEFKTVKLIFFCVPPLSVFLEKSADPVADDVEQIAGSPVDDHEKKQRPEDAQADRIGQADLPVLLSGIDQEKTKSSSCKIQQKDNDRTHGRPSLKILI